MKTKSSIKKRFKLMGSGILKMSQSGKRHGMRRRKSRVIRNNRGSVCITHSEVRRMVRGMHGVGANSIKLKSNSTMAREYYDQLCKTGRMEEVLSGCEQ